MTTTEPRCSCQAGAGFAFSRHQSTIFSVPVAGMYPPAPKQYEHYLTVGPIARHVEDLALMLPIVAGQDSRDPMTFPVPLHDFRKVRVDRLKIAYWVNYEWFDKAALPPAKEVADAVNRAASALQNLGAAIEKKCPPDWNKVDFILDTFWARAVAKGVASDLKAHGIDEPDVNFRQIIDWAVRHLTETPPTEADLACEEGLPHFQSAMLRFLEEYDALLCPVNAQPAMKHGTTWTPPNRPAFHYTIAISFLPKVPAGSAPFGWSPEGLPIGVQVVGKPYREDIVLKIMHALEQASGGFPAPSFKEPAENGSCGSGE